MAGRSRSHRRDTVAWEQPKMSPAISWVMFVRIKVTTMATDLYRPITAGPPPGLTTSPMAAATREASSVSCPSASLSTLGAARRSCWPVSSCREHPA